MAVEDTDMTRPAPAPAAMRLPMNSPRESLPIAHMQRAAPAAIMPKPPLMRGRNPILLSTMPPRTEVGIAATAPAAVTSPAARGVNPSPSWNRWVVSSSVPDRANMANPAPRTPAVNTLF